MDKHRRLLFGQIEHARFEDDFGITAVSESPNGTLGLLIDHAFERALATADIVVIDTGQDAFLAYRKLDQHPTVGCALLGDSEDAQRHPLHVVGRCNGWNALGDGHSLLVVVIDGRVLPIADVDVVVPIDNRIAVVVVIRLRPVPTREPRPAGGPRCWSPAPVVGVAIPTSVPAPMGTVVVPTIVMPPIVSIERTAIDVVPMVANRIDVVLPIDVDAVAGVDVDIADVRAISQIDAVANVGAVTNVDAVTDVRPVSTVGAITNSGPIADTA